MTPAPTNPTPLATLAAMRDAVGKNYQKQLIRHIRFSRKHTCFVSSYKQPGRNHWYVPSTLGKFKNPYPLQTVNTAAPMLTKLIVRTPALCLAKDRSFPSAAPIRAAMTSRTISRYSVAAETGQVSIWGGKAGAVDATTSDAKDHPGKTVPAARSSIMLGKALRTNPRRSL